VPFNETAIVNVSKSFDPDDPESFLKFEWECPEEIEK